MPFMIMPDAIDAIISLMNSDKNNIHSQIYHLCTFNPTPEEFYNLLRKYFPNFKISYDINMKRQEMVDSWPMDLNCQISHQEWDWSPRYNLNTAFSDYLIPEIKKQYNTKG